MVHTYLISSEDRRARLGCLLGHRREDKLTWYLECLQAVRTMAIREPHDGERLPGRAHRSGARAAALVPEAEWAFGSADPLPILASQD